MDNYPSFALGKPFYAMVDAIKERTGGRLDIEVFLPGETAWVPKDFPRAIQEGACEAADLYPGYFSATEPVLVVTNLPMLMPPNAELTEKIYDDIKDDLFQPIFAKWGGVQLCTWWFPFHAIGAPVPVVSWDSLKGIKTRVTGVEPADFIKMLGGVPVTVAFAELPTALMTGVVEAAVTAGGGFWLPKLWDNTPIKYITLMEIASMPCGTVASQKALAALPEDVRQIYLDTVKEYEPALRETQWLHDSDYHRVGIVEYGITCVAPSKKFRAEVVERTKTEVWEPWVERAGPEGRAALDLVLQKMAELGY